MELTCGAGTLCLFTTYTQHSASNYTLPDGERFLWGFALGRADHHWEGVEHYTSKGSEPDFIRLVCSLSPAERCLFRFPAVGDACYTGPMLAALEERYPGWDSSGEYRAALREREEAKRLLPDEAAAARL